MMKHTTSAFFVLLSLSLFVGPSLSFFFFSQNNVGGGKYGGNNCASCTIAVGVLEQLTQVHNTSIDVLLDDVSLSPICDYFVDKYGSQIIALIEAEQTADVVCLHLGFCTNETCRLWSPPKASLSPSFVLPTPNLGHAAHGTERARLAHRISVLADAKSGEENPGKSQETPWQWIEDLLNRMDKDHEPVVDVDHDNFSDVSTMRGYSWKGRDCNDFDISFRPGVIPEAKSEIDYNCNGISGFDQNQKLPWQEELCANSQPLGVAVVGDSFGAHFSIPPSYMNASEINSTTYADLLACIENEFDWPERSGFTGYLNLTGVMIDSIYLRMRERNLCNHRDYQNVGVNGCRSTTMQSNVVHNILPISPGLVRHQTEDYPLLLIIELIGNDVCGAHPNLSRMSTVEEFTTAIVETLEYLNDTLPAGSHIVFLGLADGRTLWNSLHNRTHPLGVSYEDVYNFLNCLEISPCWGWMNENETIRNLTSERAAELSAQYSLIIANHTFKNFDMAYYDFPFDAINEEWIKMGGETWQLIEPIDGFHPNQIAHALIAANLWDKIMSDHPTFLGNINPNNAFIQKIFGDQGGY